MPGRRSGVKTRTPAARVEIATRTVVVGLIGEDGVADAGQVYSVAASLGMTDQQVRLCIQRLVKEGRISQEGRGRRAVLRATETAHQAMLVDVSHVQFAYAQDRGLAPWDRRWRLAGFAIPEVDRRNRDTFRDVLTSLGGAALQGGLYVCANPWEKLVEAEARRLGVLHHLTMITTEQLTVGDVHDPRRLAARLWPLEHIADRHRRLVDVARPRLARLQGKAAIAQTELLTIALELATEFTDAMEPDPLLPAELLPKPWPGAQSRAMFARCWAAWQQREDHAQMPRLFRLFTDALGTEARR